MNPLKKKGGEAEKNRQKKEIYVITDAEEEPLTYGSKVTAYLTKGLAQAALERAVKDFPFVKPQITVYIPQSSRLIFIGDDEE